MFQVCIFGGHDGQLRPEKKFYLTIFGGCDLTRPTIARQILAQRRAERSELPRQQHFFFTLFGGVDIMQPTLAEEFIDMREMIKSGVLDVKDWDRAMADLARVDSSIASFTIFGRLSENELPKENKEIESLALQRHLGNIPPNAGQVLQYGIGQGGAERTATIQRAVQIAV